MLAPAERLRQLIGGLGIDNGTHVVRVVRGRWTYDLAVATGAIGP